MNNKKNIHEIRQVPEDPDIKDKEGSQPVKYHTGLKKKTKERRDSAFKRGAKKDSDDPSAYPKSHPGDADAKTKPSKYTLAYKKRFGENADLHEDKKVEKALKDKSEKSGIAYGILKDVFDRGMAAWRTGHRPGAGQQEWAYARVNSFIVGGKTRKTADADLWRKHTGKEEQVSVQEDSGLLALQNIKKRILQKSDIYKKRLVEKRSASLSVLKSRSIRLAKEIITEDIVKKSNTNRFKKYPKEDLLKELKNRKEDVLILAESILPKLISKQSKIK